ncbi:MAG TPA: subclass B3 metallo-beta-lactamase [Bryobacteraceae bacterium]|nr:subclass B3 metallo-beta-lactamase [Bryobacteraceae bacterium]
MFRPLLPLLMCATALAQVNPSWSRPYPAYKIAGNLYYVGTEDLACYLFVTPAGDILVNTGLSDSTPLIRASMRSLGFRLEDVKILLTMQAHYDHVAAMSEVQKITGAKVDITEQDAPVVEDGGKSDPYLNQPQYQYAPFKVDRRLKDGDVVSLGGTELKVILTPGHTRGSVSYSTTLMDGGQKRNVLLANINTVVMPLVHNPKYPGIAKDYERSYQVQKQLSPDIWLAAHASQYKMDAKRKAGSFVDPEGYKAAIEQAYTQYRETLEKERKTAQR